MKIVIPTFILDSSDKLEQLKITLATIHSYYYHNQNGENLPIVILTNNDFIKRQIETYSDRTNNPISVDYKKLNEVVDESLVYDYFKEKNKHKKLHHNENINCIYFYCYLTYKDSIILDNDMLFTKTCYFKHECDNDTLFVDFSNYDRSKETEWDIQHFNTEECKDTFSTHGGCMYVPKDNKSRVLIQELISGEYDMFLDMVSHDYYLTEEFFRMILERNALLYQVKNGEINIYDKYDRFETLIHLQNKPYKAFINKSKELVIKTPKPITEYNLNTVSDLFMTPTKLKIILTWYKHLAYANDILDKYFIDINHVNPNFFEKLIDAITE